MRDMDNICYPHIVSWAGIKELSDTDRCLILARWEQLRGRISVGLSADEQVEMRVLRRVIARLRSLKQRGE